MNEIIKKLRAAYDAVGYGAFEHYHAHPDRIAIVAILRGLVPPPVNHCRVLEIACAQGANLLPMAEQMPSSTFLGIDLSPRQIEVGAAIVRELGLANIEFRCQDLMEFPEDAGTFDYIIAHGIYSWVPGPVREQLLKVCRRHLSENGLAFVSYNTFPGWHSKGIIRDLMLYHARNATEPAERIERGREIVQMVAEHSLQMGSYRTMVSEYNKSMSDNTDHYLFHEHLGVVNEPVYFRGFVGDALRNGLANLGDANANDDYWGRTPSPLRETISKMSADIVEREQYMDFFTNRHFRRSVLCRVEAAAGATELSASHIRNLYIAGNPTETPGGANAAGRPTIRFGTEHDQVVLSDPRPIAAMRHLRGAWPSAVSFSKLATAVLANAADNLKDPEMNAKALAQLIHDCHPLDIVELWSRPTDHIAPIPSERPRATRLARWQAVHCPRATSLRHTAVKMDEVARNVMPLLDGTRDAQALAEEMASRNAAPGISAFRDSRSARQLIDAALSTFASLSLLVG